MLIKNLEKLPKRTLRERICEEVVHLILSGEIAKWRMRRREAGDRKTAGESNPVPRGDRDTCKGWAGRDQALSRLLCAQLFSQRDRRPLRTIQPA